MKSCPVFSAVDIAKTINSETTDNFDEVETASSIGSSIGIGSFTSSQSVFNNVASITEDEALKIILTEGKSNSVVQQLHNNPVDAVTSSLQENNVAQQLYSDFADRSVKNSEEDVKQEIKEIQQISNGYAENTDNIVDAEDSLQDTLKDEIVNDTNAATVGNSLIRKLGWSTSIEDCQSSLTSPVISHGSGTDAPRTPGEGPTYDALIQSYQTGNSTVTDLQEFLNKYPKKETVEEGSSKAQPEPKVRS